MFETMSYSDYFRIGIIVILLSGQLKIICSPNSLESGVQDGINKQKENEDCTIYAVEKRVDCMGRLLASVPGDLPRDVRNLDLGFNYIHSLWNSSFSRYTQLTYLFLYYNPISWIEHTTFQPLVNLLVLDLGSNYYKNIYISDDLFALNRGLVLLNMEDCQLTTFPVKAFQEHSGLKSLLLSGNNFTFINFTSCKMGSDGGIDLSNNLIRTIDPTTINFDCELEQLYLHVNPIETVDPDTIGSSPYRIFSFGGPGISLTTWSNFFKGVSKSRIKILLLVLSDFPLCPLDFFDLLEDHYLDQLHVRNIKFALCPELFQNLKKIKTLNLNKNKIDILMPEYFTNMTELRILHLDYNMLRVANPSNISWNMHLEELYLTNNEFRILKNFTFSGLTNLTILDLSKNRYLFGIQTVFSEGLNNLRILDLSGSQLLIMSLQVPNLKSLILKRLALDERCFIPGKTFKWVSSLTVLDIDFSLMRISSIWNANRNTSLFQGLNELKNLSLQGNNFLVLPSGVFKDLRSLTTLDLRQSFIFNIEPGAFAGMNSLQTLFLQGNQIQSLYNLLLSDLPLLMRLHVDDNQLNYLDRDTLLNTRNMTFLTIVTLSNNHLTGFNKSTFKSVRSSLLSIDLSGNPLVCDCTMKWLVFWLHDSILVKNKNEMICSLVEATLEPLRGKPLMTFNPNELCNRNPTIYTALTLLGLVILIICIFLYRNRWLVRYKVFLIKLAVLRNREIHDAREPNDFQFDINVMFTDDCEDWVQQQFRPFLTECCPHLNRQVMGDEDLPLGMHVLDAVLYTVENSFKTLLLLKPSSVNDDWFMTKFRIAIEHVNDAHRENVVLVFLDDIPNDDLPLLVRLFLSDHGSYLYWTDDITGQRYFWKELEKYLTINRRTDQRIPPE